MAAHPDGLVEFEAAGEKYTAVFGFKAMKAVEAHFGDGEPKPFFEAIASVMPQLNPEDMGDKAKVAAASARIKLTHVGSLLRFALLKHHPDLTEDDVDELVDEIGVGGMSEIIGKALSAALVKEGDAGSSKSPPKARRAQ
jgi:hypothetical protein